MTPTEDDSPATAREIAELDRELHRLTMLAASGGAEIPAVLEALRTRQTRRQALAARLQRSSRQHTRANLLQALEASLRQRLADWRGLLRQNVAAARPILETLLDGKIAVTPRTESGALMVNPTLTGSGVIPVKAGTATAPASYDVRIPLSTRGIFEGICCPN